MAGYNVITVENNSTTSNIPGNATLDKNRCVNHSSPWIPHDASLLTVLALHTVITLVAASIIACCVVWHLNKRAKRREERNKIGAIIQNNYWTDEEHISSTLRMLNRMKQNVIFRDVTELHVLGYKYRSELGIYGEPESPHHLKPTSLVSYTPSLKVFHTIKKIEHLFDSLALQLPCRGRCPKKIAAAFSSTVISLALGTVLLWSDEKARLIRDLLHYFVGRMPAEQFDNAMISDDDLETLVLARVPYVSQLYLNEDHFVLHDIEISNDLKIDLRNKVRYVDTVLAKNDKTLRNKERNLIESYYGARELCLRSGFVHNKNNLPDIVSKVGEASKVSECVGLLRHLLRIMCNNKHMRKLESDDKFFQFLMQLHETLYSWTDASAMIEVIERSRNNIFSYLRGFTAEQILMDKEFTKAKLEHVERELYRHLNYLTHKQVQQDKAKRQRFQLARADMDPKLQSVDSESSIYTMAMSASSLMMRRQQDQPEASTSRGQHSDMELLPHQASLDQASIISGSSVYATAPSLCSGDPLLGRSPPIPHRGDDGQRSPPTSVDGNDYFETAV